MPFDAMTAINQVKQNLPDEADKNRTRDIEQSMSMALADLSSRLRSQAYMTYYTETVAAAARTFIVEGQYGDAKRIFAIKLGSGTTERVLEYDDPQQFLRSDSDSSAATAGRPTRYTILNSVDGNPVLKFNCPLVASETITIYHFVEFTVDNIAMVKCSSAVVVGTLAYFCGISTPAIYKYDPISQSNVVKRPSGEKYYQAFEKLVKLSKAADTATPYVSNQFELSGQDKNIRSVIKDIQRGRK